MNPPNFLRTPNLWSFGIPLDSLRKILIWQPALALARGQTLVSLIVIDDMSTSVQVMDGSVPSSTKPLSHYVDQDLNQSVQRVCTSSASTQCHNRYRIKTGSGNGLSPVQCQAILEPMLTFCQLDPYEQPSVKFSQTIIHSRKKCLQVMGHSNLTQSTWISILCTNLSVLHVISNWKLDTQISFLTISQVTFCRDNRKNNLNRLN